MLFAFETYEMPDGGSYQPEDLVGKLLVFLIDLQYDDDATKWMSWAYLKRFLEGGDVPVVGPKNCGGNVLVKSDAPVFLTAPQEVALWRGKRVGEFETEQMRFGITYLRLHYGRRAK
jgi:ABC-type iron transport system FetAB ATPase subunit